MSIDWDKPVQTRDGREVVIYTRAGGNADYPVVGEVRLSGGTWSVNRWTSNGSDPQARTCLRLVNVRQQHTVWVSLCRNTCGDVYCHAISSAKAASDSGVISDRVACIPLTFYEGEGLDGATNERK